MRGRYILKRWCSRAVGEANLVAGLVAVEKIVSRQQPVSIMPSGNRLIRGKGYVSIGRVGL